MCEDCDCLTQGGHPRSWGMFQVRPTTTARDFLANTPLRKLGDVSDPTSRPDPSASLRPENAMHLDPLVTLAWAYQLHYYLCFRTRSRKPLITANDQLTATIGEICQRHDYHLLRAKVYPDHLRCLLSLRPTQKISDVIRTLKANSSPEPRFWERGYLARSVGHVRIADSQRIYRRTIDPSWVCLSLASARLPLPSGEAGCIDCGAFKL